MSKPRTRTKTPARAARAAKPKPARRVRSKAARDSAAASRAVAAVKIYGSGDVEVRALNSLSVEFAAGTFTAIMGPSGSGKSTLLHCLAGLDVLTSGAAYLGDTDLTALDEKDLTLLRREKVGVVFQAFNLVPTLTAIENIRLPLALASKDVDTVWQDSIIDAVGLGSRLKHHPGQLSGGEQQRVAAARALLSRPEVVFADEPTGNLDSRASTELLEFLAKAVAEFGQTIVMVTHDPIAASHAERVVFLADGTVVDEITSPTTRRVLDLMKRLET